MKMKKLKKVFSIALASVMALNLFTMTTFATAEDPTPTPAADTVVKNIPVTKYVEVTKGAAIPAQSFEFDMIPATEEQINGAKDGDVSIEPGVSLGDEKSKVVYSFTSTDTASVSDDGKVTKNGGSFDLTGVTFDHTGIYRYYVTEKAAENPEPYITYSNEKYTVDLYVLAGEKDKDGKPTYEVKGVTVTKDGDSSYTYKPQGLIFTNTINDNILTISKTVEGEEYTKDELFDFYIKIPKGGDTITLEGGTTLYARIYNGTSLVNDSRSDKDGIVTLTVNGDNDDTNVQTQGTHFQLKSGETLQISAPITMIYYLQEKDYSDEDYTQTYSYLESGTKVSTTVKNNTDGKYVSCFDDDNNLKVIKGTVNSDTNEVAFKNTRNFTAPNTGLNLDMVPYVLITLIAVCGGVLLVVRKRRVDR
jgi:hypothetical protein